MRSHSQSATISAKELCLLALMGALMFASKVAMSFLPNIHLNAVLLILAAVFFSWRALYSVGVYVMLEGMIYGFGIWWISYLYVWPLLVVAAVLLRKNDSPLIWAIVAGVHGLLFGAMCAIPYFFVGGWAAAFAYWVSGIPFDLMHCAGNFVLTLILYKPLKKAISAVIRGRSRA